jgi:hypothetical protein
MAAGRATTRVVMPPAARTITDITEARMSASTVHVEPNSKGRWIVRCDDEREPLSEHESATEAAHIARELAQLEGASLVLLHDRYSRIHRLHRECGQCENPTPRRLQRAAQLKSEREARSRGVEHLGEHPSPRSSDGGSPSSGKTAASGDAE